MEATGKFSRRWGKPQAVPGSAGDVAGRSVRSGAYPGAIERSGRRPEGKGVAAGTGSCGRRTSYRRSPRTGGGLDAGASGWGAIPAGPEGTTARFNASLTAPALR